MGPAGVQLTTVVPAGKEELEKEEVTDAPTIVVAPTELTPAVPPYLANSLLAGSILFPVGQDVTVVNSFIAKLVVVAPPAPILAKQPGLDFFFNTITYLPLGADGFDSLIPNIPLELPLGSVPPFVSK